MTKVVLKHLAREFDIDPHALRKLLRKQFRPKNRRWKWDEGSNALEKVRRYLRGVKLVRSYKLSLRQSSDTQSISTPLSPESISPTDSSDEPLPTSVTSLEPLSKKES